MNGESVSSENPDRFYARLAEVISDQNDMHLHSTKYKASELLVERKNRWYRITVREVV